MTGGDWFCASILLIEWLLLTVLFMRRTLRWLEQHVVEENDD